MLYRWGFIENEVYSECKPIVDDDAAIDFAPQTNEVFYRAKLNGGLSFRFEFDDILAKGYNYEHIVVLQYFNEDLNEWGEVWRGRFTLTDCEVDYDTHTINVQPETQDRYTNILDALDKEYNLIKLAPQQQPVNILIRPCLQVYLQNTSKVTNYIGHNFWESDCEAIKNDGISNNHYTKIDEYFFCTFTWIAGPNNGKVGMYFGKVAEPYVDFDLKGWIISGNDMVEDNTLVCQKQTGAETWFWVEHRGLNDAFFAAIYENEEAGTEPLRYFYLYNDQQAADGFAQWDRILARLLINSEYPSVYLLGNTYTTYDIQNTDMAGQNANYNKIIEYATGIEISGTSETQLLPTQWGQSYFNDRYFIKPTDTATKRYLPIGIDFWKYASYWFYDKPVSGGGYCMEIADAVLSRQHQISDCYLLESSIVKLLERAGWTGGVLQSRAFSVNNDYVGDAFVPVIAPRSNVISSYYNTPAQNAPVTLTKLLNMLKQAYKAYWYIDSNNNFIIEHISYFDNGYSYSDAEPDLLVNLENRHHTNTKENKVFGQNKIKYDKQDMPEKFSFGWGDEQTKPFDGWQILCKDNYVRKGTSADHIIGDFDTDVDFVLASPNEVSKEGLFLFACPAENGVINFALKIDKIQVTDDSGLTYYVTIQNADAAFAKIHQSWWRYSLPCENINVNNQDTTAITTGRYKLQNVEFADEIMAEILADIDNCNKVIRTQQGDGKIKSLSINLNSLKAKGDLLFNFVGRWYYLRGTALGASIIINVDNEPITIEVENNKWRLKYAEPMTALDFNGADVVSVDFADCDRLENLTTADGMFENCAELLAVDFGGKKLAAVTSAIDMFAGCAQLNTLICPQTSTWKPDLSFADCPDLTTESVYSLIGFLYDYDAGVHTIDFNSTMWNALDADTQTDITTKAGAKGWTIGTAVAYYISGQSAAGTVYATINGASVEIPVSGGAFNYTYYAPITSLSFENDADVTDIDFSLSDGLAGVTSLANAFKNCAGLTTLDFTNCDLTNVTTASDCFAGCVALYTLEIPTGTWKPDVDLSDTVILYSEMLNVVDGLYSYTGGVHNVTFNSTIWDAMSVPEQQAVFDAAALKYWTTNSVAVVYVVRGTSSNVNGTESFAITFIDDGSLTPSAAETLTIAVDGNGDFEYTYQNKKIYSLSSFAINNSTLLTIEFTEEMAKCSTMDRAFRQCTNLTSALFPNATFNACTSLLYLFYLDTKLTTIDLSKAIFGLVTTIEYAFNGCTLLNAADMPMATFASVTLATNAFYNCVATTSIDLSSATFASLISANYMFNAAKATTLKLGLATFANVTSATFMFYQCGCTKLELPNATFDKLQDGSRMVRQMANCTEVDLSSATFALTTNGLYMFYGNPSLVTLKIDNATFASLTNANYMFTVNNVLTTIVATKVGTFPISVSLQNSPLTYQSMLNFANLLKDLSGLTAQTITYKATAWNALSAAEQSTIDTILSGKNWTRAIA